MNMKQTKRYNRGIRLTVELNELIDRYQKLKFFLDTTEDVEPSTKYILKTQSSVMEEYMKILTKRLENGIY